MHKNFVFALGGEWEGRKSERRKSAPLGGQASKWGITGRLEEIRTKHQNAYKKWTNEEENMLSPISKKVNQ